MALIPVVILLKLLTINRSDIEMFFNTEKRNELNGFYKDNFVEFPDPQNPQGKKIYVDKSQVVRFENMLKARNRNFNLLYITRQIFSLKDVGHLNALVSKVAPTSRKLMIEGGSILYSVWQGNIYITSVNISTNFRFENGTRKIPAGVYRVEKQKISDQKWDVTENRGLIESKAIVNTKHLAINGVCRDINDAANYMPAFIEYGHGEQSLKGDIYSLFFNPSQGFGAGWRSMKESAGIGSQTSRKLAAVLEQSKGKEISITVHECGHALFKDALRQLNAKEIKLDTFTVFYANPTHNLTLVDIYRKRSGIKLANKAPLINSFNIQQSLSSGNIISGPFVAASAQPDNKAATLINAGASLWGTQGLMLGASAGALAITNWGIGVLPFALGLAPDVNKKVISDFGTAVVEGGKSWANAATQTSKLVWDPIHKMMVKA